MDIILKINHSLVGSQIECVCDYAYAFVCASVCVSLNVAPHPNYLQLYVPSISEHIASSLSLLLLLLLLHPSLHSKNDSSNSSSSKSAAYFGMCPVDLCLVYCIETEREREILYAMQMAQNMIKLTQSKRK